MTMDFSSRAAAPKKSWRRAKYGSTLAPRTLSLGLVYRGYIRYQVLARQIYPARGGVK